MQQPSLEITVKDVQRVLGRHVPLYRHKTPFYQTTLLKSLWEVWSGPHSRLLDVGGGTGVIAQAISEIFPIDHVEGVDVVNRRCPTISVKFQEYDGHSLPYSANQFDAGMINNVIHHVPIENRVALLREIKRVVGGPLYVKDHESRGIIDIARLAAIDAIGNIPFGGMVKASYLTHTDWEALAAASGYKIAARAAKQNYRSNAYALLFPNRLETTMRFEPL